MPEWLSKLLQQWESVVRAPVPFIVAVVCVAVILKLGLDWQYNSRLENKNGEIANKNSEIAFLQREIEAYRSKLGGASPNEAKARIDDLEARLARVEPRQLSPEARKAITSVLSGIGGSYTVVVDYDGNCSDCNNFGVDLESLIRHDTGWRIESGLLLGVPNKSPKGLSIQTADPTRPSAAASALARAFSAAGLPFDMQATELQPGVDSVILVTPRVEF